MIKQRTNQGQRGSIRNFRMLQQFGREQYKQKPEQGSQKENNFNRLEYLRKKYSQKQRSVSAVRPSKQVEIRVPIEQKTQIQKEINKDLNKQYLKLRQGLGNRFSLNQINRPLTIKQNQRLRRLQSEVIDKSLNPSHIQSVNNFEAYQNQLPFTRSTSSYFKSDVQNRDKSRQKVSQRVQNINNINEKIKNLLNRFDATISPPPFNISRESRQIKDISQSNFNLKDKKNSFIENQYKHQQAIQSNIYQEPKLSQKQQNLEVFSDINYTKDIKTSKVSIYESQNMVDESFVVLKYSPKDKPKHSGQLQNLMYKLSIQIQYDENFRTTKYFLLLSKIPDKYERLQQELQLKGIKYSLEDLKCLMKFTQQEYNPFIYQQAHEDFSKFCDTIIISQEYWQTNICKKFNYQKLKEQGIQNIMVFDNKQDEMLISDLVRFVNLGSGNLYKNRDLVLIARRINKNQNNLSPSQIFQTFCGNVY